MLETGRTFKSVSIQDGAPTTRRTYEQTFPNFFKDRRFSSAVESVNNDRSNISMLEAYEAQLSAAERKTEMGMTHGQKSFLYHTVDSASKFSQAPDNMS